MESNDLLEFKSTYLVVWDYVVLALFLIVSLSIGVYQAYLTSAKKSTNNFLLANRLMSIVPVSMSHVATILSANLLLNYTAEVSVSNIGAGMFFLGLGAGAVITVILFLPFLYRLKVINIYEYLERRFHKSVMILATLIFIIFNELGLAVLLYIPALSMNIVTGLNEWIAVSVIGVVSVVYTSIGGMKAVLWTDVLQYIMMVLGMLCVFVSGIFHFGSFKNIWSIYQESGRAEIFNLDPDPRVTYSFWNVFIGSTFMTVALLSVNQANVQRSMSLPSLAKGRIAMLLTFPFFSLVIILCSLSGVVIFAQYHACDPIKVNRISRKEGLVPLYVMEMMGYPGFPGFFFACVFSGALSSISSVLNSLAAVIYKDVLFIPCGWFKAEDKEFNFLRIITFLSGVVMMLLTVVVSKLGFLFMLGISIMSLLAGSNLGVFVLGIFLPWSNYKGALAGLGAGFLVGLWVVGGNIIYKPPSVGFNPPPMHTANCLSLYAKHNSIKQLGNLSFEDSSFENSSFKEFVFDNSFVGNSFDTNSSLKNLYNGNSSFKEQLLEASEKQNSTKEPSSLSSFQSPLMPFYQISFWLYTPLTFFTTLLTGIIVSFLTGHTKRSEVDDLLLSPLWTSKQPTNLSPITISNKKSIYKDEIVNVNSEGEDGGAVEMMEARMVE